MYSDTFNISHIITFIRCSLEDGTKIWRTQSLRVNPISLSYPFPLVLRVHVRVRAIPILVLIEG